MNDEDKPNNSIKIEQGYGVAASLLWEDRIRLPIFLILLALPRYLKYMMSLNSPFNMLLCDFIDNGIEIAFLGYIAAQVIGRISTTPPAVNKLRYLRLFAYGSLFWAAVKIPALVESNTEAPLLQSASLLVVVVGVCSVITFHFYFIPIIAGIRDFNRILAFARQYTIEDWVLPFRASVTPLALMMLLEGFMFSFSPDGRSTMLMYSSDLLYGLWKVLSIYLSVAFGIVFLGNREAAPLAFRPYYQAQIMTISAGGPGWLKHWLHMRNGFLLLLAASLVYQSNSIRLDSIPPAAKIEVTEVTPLDKKVIIRLRVRDEEFSLRGFHPLHFALGSRKRSIVSDRPESAKINGEEFELLQPFPESRDPQEIVLEFKTTRSKELLMRLEDLQLWYRNSIVAPIIFVPPAEELPAKGGTLTSTPETFHSTS